MVFPARSSVSHGTSMVSHGDPRVDICDIDVFNLGVLVVGNFCRYCQGYVCVFGRERTPAFGCRRLEGGE